MDKKLVFFPLMHERNLQILVLFGRHPHDRVVRASDFGAVDSGLFPCRVKLMTLKLFDAQPYGDSVENKPVSCAVGIRHSAGVSIL